MKTFLKNLIQKHRFFIERLTLVADSFRLVIIVTYCWKINFNFCFGQNLLFYFIFFHFADKFHV